MSNWQQHAMQEAPGRFTNISNGNYTFQKPSQPPMGQVSIGPAGSGYSGRPSGQMPPQQGPAPTVQSQVQGQGQQQFSVRVDGILQLPSMEFLDYIIRLLELRVANAALKQTRQDRLYYAILHCESLQDARDCVAKLHGKQVHFKENTLTLNAIHLDQNQPPLQQIPQNAPAPLHQTQMLNLNGGYQNVPPIQPQGQQNFYSTLKPQIQSYQPPSTFSNAQPQSQNQFNRVQNWVQDSNPSFGVAAPEQDRNALQANRARIPSTGPNQFEQRPQRGGFVARGGMAAGASFRSGREDRPRPNEYPQSDSRGQSTANYGAQGEQEGPHARGGRGRGYGRGGTGVRPLSMGPHDHNFIKSDFVGRGVNETGAFEFSASQDQRGFNREAGQGQGGQSRGRVNPSGGRGYYRGFPGGREHGAQDGEEFVPSQGFRRGRGGYNQGRGDADDAVIANRNRQQSAGDVVGQNEDQDQRSRVARPSRGRVFVSGRGGRGGATDRDATISQMVPSQNQRGEGAPYSRGFGRGRGRGPGIGGSAGGTGQGRGPARISGSGAGASSGRGQVGSATQGTQVAGEVQGAAGTGEGRGRNRRNRRAGKLVTSGLMREAASDAEDEEGEDKVVAQTERGEEGENALENGKRRRKRGPKQPPSGEEGTEPKERAETGGQGGQSGRNRRDRTRQDSANAKPLMSMPVRPPRAGGSARSGGPGYRTGSRGGGRGFGGRGSGPRNPRQSYSELTRARRQRNGFRSGRNPGNSPKAGEFYIVVRDILDPAPTPAPQADQGQEGQEAKPTPTCEEFKKFLEEKQVNPKEVRIFDKNNATVFVLFESKESAREMKDKLAKEEFRGAPLKVQIGYRLETPDERQAYFLARISQRNQEREEVSDKPFILFYHVDDRDEQDRSKRFELFQKLLTDNSISYLRFLPDRRSFYNVMVYFESNEKALEALEKLKEVKFAQSKAATPGILDLRLSRALEATVSPTEREALQKRELDARYARREAHLNPEKRELRQSRREEEHKDIEQERDRRLALGNAYLAVRGTDICAGYSYELAARATAETRLKELREQLEKEAQSEGLDLGIKDVWAFCRRRICIVAFSSLEQAAQAYELLSKKDIVHHGKHIHLIKAEEFERPENGEGEKGDGRPPRGVGVLRRRRNKQRASETGAVGSTGGDASATLGAGVAETGTD